MIYSWRGNGDLACVAILLLLLSVRMTRATLDFHHRVLVRSSNGKPTFLRGNLGSVQSSPQQGIVAGDSEHALSVAATAALETILRVHVGSTGRESLQLVRMRTDRRGNTHIRFKGLIDGLPVEAASMVMHIDSEGTVYALNGELVSAVGVPSEVKLSCDEAFARALSATWALKKVSGEWRSGCELVFVQAMTGIIHKAWMRTLAYEKLEQGMSVYHVDKLFASVETGEIVAILPQIDGVAGVPALITRDCLQSYDPDACTVVSNSSGSINTSDAAVNAAHNHARDAYNYYWSTFGRDSFDNNGSPCLSFVHFGSNFVNAFRQDGVGIVYGDGDGTDTVAFSLGLDIVAHEYTHLVTKAESDLMNSYEPGAVNEALSDIMGATIEHVVKKKTVEDTFRIGEDVYLTARGLRNMANPQSFGDPDFYPTRRLGSMDRGNIHFNNGIMNLAFSLMVKGGTHPQRKTTINVTRFDSNFTKSIELAAAVFYHANADCFTAQTGFREARLCTENHAGGFKPTVSQAWEAVGVTSGMLNVISLTDGVTRTGLSAPKSKLRHFRLQNLKPGGKVTCTVNRGISVELYVGNQGFPDSSNKTSPVNSCVSTGSGSVKACTTTHSISMEMTSLYVTLKAVDSYANVSLTCKRNDPVPLALRNGSPLYVRDAGIGDLLYYSSAGKVRSGVNTLVQLTGNNGDADLYVGYGIVPDVDNGDTYESMSANAGSNEVCDGVAPSNFTLYAVVLAYDSVTDLKVLVRHHPNSITLSDGVVLGSQSSFAVDTIQDYALTGLVTGKKIKCELSGSARDAELFVRIGDLPETSISSSVNACSSTGNSTTKSCTTRAVTDQTTAYATVYTRRPYNNVSVRCSMVDSTAPTTAPETFSPTAAPTSCMGLGGACTVGADCCAGARIICEGATSTSRTCKKCLKLAKPCRRSSQCCSRKCQSGQCRT